MSKWKEAQKRIDRLLEKGKIPTPEQIYSTEQVVAYSAFRRSLERLKVRIPEGDGRAVVFIPGLDFQASNWQPAQQLLEDRKFRVYNRLGRMVEEKLNERFDSLMETIEEARNDTGRAVTLVGHSIGGVFALTAGYLNSRSVGAVVTIASAFNCNTHNQPPPGEKEILRGIQMRLSLRSDSRTVPESFAELKADLSREGISVFHFFSPGDRDYDEVSCTDPTQPERNIQLPVVYDHRTIIHSPNLWLTIGRTVLKSE